MKFYFLIAIGLFLNTLATGQTNTTTSGIWTDPSIWSPGVPGSGNITANVNNPIEINTNIAIGTSGTGVYNIFQSATDFPGGNAYTLTIGGNGTLDVQGGTTYFGGVVGSVTSNGATIRVRNGATLILTGPTAFANGTTVTIDAGGTLIINGNFDNNISGAGSFTVQGIVQINGNYTSNGNVDILGSGDFFTTGSVTTTGGSGEIFGSNNDCSGPCSGQNLCLGTNVNIISANQYICSGGSATGLTGDAIASVLSYQWQSSTTSSSSGFTDISGATSQNYNPGTPSQTTWYKRRASITGCTGTSSAIVITIIPSASWRGTTSSDWNVASNWCSNSLPTSATDVVIPAGVPNQPIVSAATTALCRNLTISSGASVTVNSTRQLSVSGNIVNNGTLSVSGTLQLNGTSAQSITGSGFSSYATVIVNNSSGATPAITLANTGINILTQLTLTAGKVNLSSANLTIGTGVGSAGTLSYSGGWLYNGNITRWIATGALTLGNAPGHFPIGSSADYRPVYLGNSNVTTGGTIRVNHSATSGATAVSFNDGGTPIQVRSNSFWTIATGNGLATANNFSLRTEGTGFGTVGAFTDLRLTQANSASFGAAGVNAGPLSNPQVNRTGIPTANLSNSFYWGSINSTQTPLPIELVDFNAKQVDSRIVLNWATSSELNNDFFTIERLNAEDDLFDQIAVVKGSGTINEARSYHAYDFTPKAGKNYYRLKQTDFDGKFTYSKIVMVDFQGSGESVSVYPNPTNQETITVEVKQLKPGQQVPLQIRSTLGVQTFSAIYHADSVGNIKVSIQVDQWSQGLYFIQIGTEAGIQRKIMIE